MGCCGKNADPEVNQAESRKPKDTNLKQQKLKAWQPVLTADTVLIVFLAIGLAFIPIGVALYTVQSGVQEYREEYTDCIDLGGSGKSCAVIVEEAQGNITNCTCQKNITVTEAIEGNVYMYYALTNFFQNHRRYVKSRDDKQLRGESGGLGECAPFDKVGGVEIAPCGAIANSMFNDTLTLTYVHDNGTTEPVTLLNTGIAWSTDKNVKFVNPGKNLTQAFSNTVKPMNWHKNVYDLDPTNANNNGYENEDLIVWMRAAAFPSFRKLYRRINHDGTFKSGLPKGTYIVNIDYKFPVTVFRGTKSVVISSTSVFGGRNLFLGIAYMVVGSLCIILCIVFFIIHKKLGQRTSELTNVSLTTSYQ